MIDLKNKNIGINIYPNVFIKKDEYFIDIEI